MKMDFRARLPSLNREARLLAWRSAGPDGVPQFKVIEITGDEVVRRQVIARYLKAEIEAAQKGSEDVALNSRNYRFRFLGRQNPYGLDVYIFELEPRRKAVGLFRGQLWIDAKTLLPVREYGLFVRTPSIFLRDIYFVRDYWITDGLALPRRVLSTIDVRLVGKAELEIWYSDYDIPPDVWQNNSFSSTLQ